MTDENIELFGSERNAKIKVIGVGGCGCNAVKTMQEIGISGVNFVVCNTDLQVLNDSPIRHRIQLGAKLTKGLGAGNDPEVGRSSALESLDEIRDLLDDGHTQMVFVTAGMGGGTGTGAAPVIANVAKGMGLLTVAVVTIPEKNEGFPRIRQATEGVRQMSQCVDSLLIVNNQRLRELYSDLPVSKSFQMCDNVLARAVKGISEIISIPGFVNIDFADVKKAMTDSGVSVVGLAEGETQYDAAGKVVLDRGMDAIKKALDSPLTNNSDIRGAQYVLVNMVSSSEKELTQGEQGAITDYLCSLSGSSSRNRTLITGYRLDDTLGDKVQVTVVATGFAVSCFEDNVEQPSDNAIMIDENGQEIGMANQPDNPDEKPNSIELPVEDEETQRIIDRLYRPAPQSKSTVNAEREYQISSLMPPQCHRLSDFRNEDFLTRFETEPACIRRRIK